MIDDGVEGHILVLKVPFRGLNIVHPLVRFNEALKAPINHRAMGQCAFFTWNTEHREDEQGQTKHPFLYLYFPHTHQSQQDKQPPFFLCSFELCWRWAAGRCPGRVWKKNGRKKLMKANSKFCVWWTACSYMFFVLEWSFQLLCFYLKALSLHMLYEMCYINKVDLTWLWRDKHWTKTDFKFLSRSLTYSII